MIKHRKPFVTFPILCISIFPAQYYKFILLLLFLNVSILPIIAQRQVKTLNEGWLFTQGDVESAERIVFDDSKWQKVNIPHSWNSDAYIEKNYYRGSAWYRKAFTVPEAYKNKQLFMRFEGINQVASVYINGEKVGEHKGGYTSFTFNITSVCKVGADNIIAIKVSNALADVPPVSGDFTIFGGIYRDVWLIVTPNQHIDLSNHGSDGIFVDTDHVSETSASYTVKGAVVNSSAQKTALRVTHLIKDPYGLIVQKFEERFTLNAYQKADFKQTGMLLSPFLWTPDTPFLYTIETHIIDDKTKKSLDEVTSPLGFRWYKFDGKEGFFLNGKPYRLNGVCRHQDQMPIGNALSDEAHRRDMQLIKDMGANFIRISHYPQDKAIIEQCDKLGILVWEEIPVIDIIPEEASFDDNCETALREMIRQHYNHPSVIMWGYMNEILLVTQRKHSGRELEALINRELKLAERLEKVLKEEDTQRYSVMAFHGSDLYNKTGFAEIVDVVGWNLYQGWYSDDMNQFDKFIRRQQEQYPHKPKIVSEYGAGSDKRIHSLVPRRFDFSIEYQQEYVEHYISVIEREPYICGATYWNFIDFGSAQRDESMPRINNKGLVYADRTPKDIYYLFKASYRKDIPVLHIASHDWIYRTGVSINAAPVIQPVKVYSNLQDLELFMNGKSLGLKEIKNYKAVWDVPFTDGKHYFSVKGKYKGHDVETGITITFISVPEKLSGSFFRNRELAINVGSDAFYTSEESHLTWLPDKEYTAGSWGYVGGEKHATQAQIMGTADNPLFQTLRVSPEMYRFDVPEGEYEVELLFADIFQTSKGIAHSLLSDSQHNNSDNAFGVVINNVAVDPLIDLKNTVGHYYGIKKKYMVKVTHEGYILVALNTCSGKNFLNGIKLRKL